MALLIFRIVMWVVPWRYFTHGTPVIISPGTMVNGNYTYVCFSLVETLEVGRSWNFYFWKYFIKFTEFSPLPFPLSPSSSPHYFYFQSRRKEFR